MYYIEKIGHGAKAKFCVKRVSSFGTEPVPGCRPVRSAAAARAQATALGIEIAGAGEFYQIVAAYNRQQNSNNEFYNISSPAAGVVQVG